MSAPIVTITNVSRYKLSHDVAHDDSLITFEFDQDVTNVTMNLLGVSYDTGMVLDSIRKDVANTKLMTVAELKNLTVREVRSVVAGTPITMQVVADDLTSEGPNRVNIYGENLNNEWTPYDQA